MQVIRLGLTLLYLLAGTASVLAAIALLRRRQVPAARWLAGMILCAGWWAVCDAIELHLTTVAAKQLLSAFQYAGVVSASPCFFRAALALARPYRPFSLQLLAFIWGIPLLSLIGAWTNPLHHAVWSHIAIDPAQPVSGTYYYGWLFWILTAHAYLLMALAAVLVLRAAAQVRRQSRLPLRITMIAVCLPWLGNAAYVGKLGPVPGLNWSTIAVIITGVMLAWAVERRGLVDVLPRARELLAERLPQGVLVLDDSGRVAFSNRAAQALLWNGEASGQVPPELSGQGELRLGERWLDLRAVPLRDRWNRITGRLLVFQDISERKQLELERESLIDELTQALARERSLESILPICANCHRIRSGSNAWTRLDEYISSRIDVQFSQVLCPDCARGSGPGHPSRAEALERST